MKISVAEFNVFFKEFFSWNSGQRLGQAFCNAYNINNDSYLFYEQNTAKAIDYIAECYLAK